jgi:hypothetical protein
LFHAVNEWIKISVLLDLFVTTLKFLIDFLLKAYKSTSTSNRLGKDFALYLGPGDFYVGSLLLHRLDSSMRALLFAYRICERYMSGNTDSYHLKYDSFFISIFYCSYIKMDMKYYKP